MKKSVYLAGPVGGCTYAEARNGWRLEFAAKLSDEIEVFSPLRGIHGYEDEQVFTNENQKNISGNWWVLRDLNDVKTCDAVVVNFRGAKKVSVGSIAEIFYGAALGKHFIVIDDWEDGTSPHIHPFIEKLAYKIVPTLEDAKRTVEKLLLPGV